MHLPTFLLHWAITAFSLWAASHVFRGLRFDSAGALWISALLLGFANAVLRPVLIFLTFPLTLLTLGGFILVINAFMILLVSNIVRGFKVDSFWTAFFASLFIALLSLVLGALLVAPGPSEPAFMPHTGTWL